MKKINTTLVGLIFLIFFTLAADITDLYLYTIFLREHGIGVWSVVHPKYILEYGTTFPGNIATVCALAPWVILLGYSYISGGQHHKE